jgi:hypothetical protein
MVLRGAWPLSTVALMHFAYPRTGTTQLDHDAEMPRMHPTMPPSCHTLGAGWHAKGWLAGFGGWPWLTVVFCFSALFQRPRQQLGSSH